MVAPSYKEFRDLVKQDCRTHDFLKDLSEEELTEAFNTAIAGVRTAQVTLAARDSDFDGHTIHSGEYLALLDGALVACSADLNEILDASAARFNEDAPEIVTVYSGADVDESGAEAARARLSDALPDADVSLVSGGQPVYHFIISAE